MGDVTRVAKESLEAPRLVKVYNAQEHVSRRSTRSTSTTCAPTCG